VAPVLFVENHDSFSWNVVDALPVPREAVCVVVGAEAAAPFVEEASVVVVGTGPTDPERAGLVALMRKLATLKKPTLGICLGHQALGLAFGATLVRARPTHGETDGVVFGKSRFFGQFLGEQTVMRYHSLALTAVAAPLRVIARSSDGLVQAIEHETLPMAGLQFHPDSYGTVAGPAYFEAFFRAVQ